MPAIVVWQKHGSEYITDVEVMSPITPEIWNYLETHGTILEIHPPRRSFSMRD